MQEICIIDDDEDSNMLLASYLEEKWSVATFQNWMEAENSIVDNPPALLLLDISLESEADGVTVLKRLREKARLKHVKAIAITGYSMPGDREHFLRQGFDEYLPKPISDKRALVNLVQKCLDSSAEEIKTKTPMK